jgi:hypothetical protein
LPFIFDGLSNIYTPKYRAVITANIITIAADAAIEFVRASLVKLGTRIAAMIGGCTNPIMPNGACPAKSGPSNHITSM